MPISFSISSSDDHIRLDVSGEYSRGKDAVEAKDIWRQVADACREQGLTRVLAVSGIVGEMPTMVSFSIGSEPESFGWERKFRVAMVFLDKERYESNLFSETILTNRYYEMKAFKEEDSARQWLLQS